MTRQCLTLDTVSLGDHATGDDLLERQLEKLFSDAPLTLGTPTRRSPVGTHTIEETSRPGWPAPVEGLDPIAWFPLSRLKSFVRRKWLMGLAWTLAACAALTLVLVPSRGLARPADNSGLFSVSAIPPAQEGAAVVTSPPLAQASLLQTGTSVRPLDPVDPSPSPTPKPSATNIPGVTIQPSPTEEPTLAATGAGEFRSTPTLEALPTASPSATAKPTFTATPAATPSQLDAAPAVPTKLLIPAIGLEAPIIEVHSKQLTIDGQVVSTWAVPDHFAVGWHQTSALPGEGGNTVLNGHQSIHEGVFRDLSALQLNAEITVYVGDTAHHYRVSERHLLPEEGQPLHSRVENARWIMPTREERLTLVTCAPDARSTHRLIVVALPSEAGPEPAAPNLPDRDLTIQ